MIYFLVFEECYDYKFDNKKCIAIDKHIRRLVKSPQYNM